MTTPTIPKPNYTQTPNVIFDELLPTLGYAELKVLMWLCRQTFGWHEEWTGGPQRNASIRATVAGTGLSKPAVISAYASLEGRGLAEWRNGPNGDVEWRIKTDASGGKAALPAGANGVVKLLDQGGKATCPPLVKLLDPLKETETNVKEQTPRVATATTDAGAALDAGGGDYAPQGGAGGAPNKPNGATAPVSVGNGSQWADLAQTIALDVTGSEDRAYQTTGKRAGRMQAWVGHIVGDVGKAVESDVGGALDLWIMFRGSIKPAEWEQYVTRSNVRERFGKWTQNGGATSVAAVLADVHAGRADTPVTTGGAA